MKEIVQDVYGDSHKPLDKDPCSPTSIQDCHKFFFAYFKVHFNHRRRNLKRQGCFFLSFCFFLHSLPDLHKSDLQ